MNKKYLLLAVLAISAFSGQYVHAETAPVTPLENSSGSPTAPTPPMNEATKNALMECIKTVPKGSDEKPEPVAWKACLASKGLIKPKVK